MAGWLKQGSQDFLMKADCDVWLLTEVNESVELPGYAMHRGQERMAARRHWAAVFSRTSLTPRPDPHVASAAAGDEWAGTKGGRAHVLAAVDELGLKVSTADLPHRLEGLLSIDHIGVPTSWTVRAAERLDAVGLSDHDCYVVDVEVPRP
jgi:hypothetical protein